MAEGTLDEVTIHNALSNARRRRIIEFLAECEEGELTPRELSERIATAETGEDPAPRSARQSVYVSLQQNHLPHLEDIDAVETTPTGNEVRLAESAAELREFMGPLRRFRLAWSEYYVAVAVLGYLTIVASGIGVPPLSALDPAPVAGFFLLFVVTSAGYQMVVAGEGRFG